MRTKLSALLAALPSRSAAPLQTMAGVVVLCGFAACSPAAIVHYGNDVAFSEPPEGEGHRPNYLLGSKYTVTQPIVLQKAGILFGSAITNAKVGIYTDAGGAPHTLVAETGSFEVYFDSVLETPLLTTPAIPAGDYWFMAVFDSVETPVGISYDASAQAAFIAHTFNAPLPATFPAPNVYTGVAFNYYLIGETTISGDFDDDGDVDGDDLAQWEGDFGVNDLSNADGDNDSDGNDFLVWQRHVGGAPAFGAAIPATGAVPEPGSMLLAAFGVAALAAGRSAD